MAFGFYGEAHITGAPLVHLAPLVAIWAIGIIFGTPMGIITILITAGRANLTVFNALIGMPAKPVPADI